MEVHQMKYLSRLLLIVIYIISMFSAPVYASESSDKSIRLSAEEMMWLENNKNRTFTLGLTPQAGFEYFSYNEEQDGYMLPLANKISADLGIKINLSVTDNWNEVYSGLQNGSVDILYGANETAERSKFMVFTKPVLKTPYAIVSKKDGPVHTIGDLDNRWVGFVRGDFAADELSKLYKNVNYNRRLFRSQDEGIEALKNGEIDAFIILGGPIVYDYIYRFPELSYAFKIGSITSDMTFSTRKEDKVLVDILIRKSLI
jgi:ABC-type amino acid transport substrate-binding protein